MDAFFIEEKINHLLAEKFQEEDFTDCFLVGIELHKNKLDVFIDSDSGLSLRQCQGVSRYLESYLDEEQVLGEKYTLEVSSPGLSRPLKMVRQYKKNIGRKLKIALQDGTEKTAELKAVGESSITVEEILTVREKKKKKKITVQTELPFDEIN
ncbi:MAG TPA: hypothetical protein ENJ95_00415, partial [Bacteroidetes bacterium]|nr:hypothetical protein [Bacteroidota bacterium]